MKEISVLKEELIYVFKVKKQTKNVWEKKSMKGEHNYIDSKK